MRWRLMNAHYLNVPRMPDGQHVEWEYNETTRDGKANRLRFQVPIYLDPKDPSFWTHKNDEMIVVAHADGERERRDIIFIGEPTPDMEPLDDEAEALTESLRPKWSHPIDDLPAIGGGYGDQLMAKFESMINALVAANPDAAKAQPPNVGGVTQDQFAQLAEKLEALAARNEELAQQNAALQAQLASQAEGSAPSRRA